MAQRTNILRAIMDSPSVQDRATKFGQNRLAQMLQPLQAQQAQMNVQTQQNQMQDADRERIGKASSLFLSALGDDYGALQGQEQAQRWMQAKQATQQAGFDLSPVPDQPSQQWLGIAQRFQKEFGGAGQDSIQSTFVNDQGERVALYRSGKTETLGGAFNRPMKITVAGREMILDPNTGKVTDPATGEVLGYAGGRQGEPVPESSSQPTPQGSGRPGQGLTREEIARQEAEQEARRAEMVEKGKTKGRGEAEEDLTEPQRRVAAQQQMQQFSGLIDTIDSAIQNVGGFTAGFGGTMLSSIPGTPARDLQRTIDTIQANLGFDRLQAMREASPTGGALGSVSERELGLLTSAVQSLATDQSPTQLRENLQRVRTHYDNWKRAVEQSLQEGGGNAVSATGSAGRFKIEVIE